MAIDRKALIRDYKDTPRAMGVGVVRQVATGKSLVVAGRDILSVLNRNHAQLKLGGHPNRSLQADWNALGADAFKFEVVDTLTPKDDADLVADLHALEQLWIDKLQPFEPAGYHRALKSP